MLIVGAFSLASILGALYFQYFEGLAPCVLCLQQRWPHYIAIGVAVIGIVMRPRLGFLFLFLLLGLMLWSAGLAAYHSGVEWAWWPGPAGCSAAATLPDAGNLLEAMGSARVPSCTEALWRLFGLSLAGYNAILSAAMVGLLLWSLLARRKTSG
jgi:disulfide bond formation protein DsbB